MASGEPGAVHLCAGQGYPANMHVECSNDLSRKHPVGTLFRIRAKLTDRGGSGDFLYSYFGCKYEIIK
jgi:hypothetical protein